MKRYCIFIFFFFIQEVVSQEEKFPNLIRRVNDLAHFLNQKTITVLERALENHEKNTTNQIVILTVDTIQPYTIEEYGIKIAEKWKIGQKNQDNGIIIILAKQERKVRIEVGYGLEGDLPDAKCKQIIEEKMIPYFKKGDFNYGILKGVEEILKTLEDSESIALLLEEEKQEIDLNRETKDLDIIKGKDESELEKAIKEKQEIMMNYWGIYLIIGIPTLIIVTTIIFDKNKKFKSLVRLTLIAFFIVFFYWLLMKIYIFSQEKDIQQALLQELSNINFGNSILFGILYMFLALGNMLNLKSSKVHSRDSESSWNSSSSSSWSSGDFSDFSGGGGSFGGGGASGSW
ncbi:MAG: TPM domain-containing protein [Leptonema sp. (in: bacteria)]